MIKAIIINKSATKAQFIKGNGRPYIYKLSDKQAERLFKAVYNLTPHTLPGGSTKYYTDNNRIVTGREWYK